MGHRPFCLPPQKLGSEVCRQVKPADWKLDLYQIPIRRDHSPSAAGFALLSNRFGEMKTCDVCFIIFILS